MVFSVAAGFVLWSALWIGSDLTLLLLSPEWYGNGLKNFSTTVFVISLVRSISISIISGYVTALIAGRQSPMLAALALGVLLLAFGIYVEAALWNSIPLWYHLIFLVLLIPATLFGARRRAAV